MSIQFSGLQSRHDFTNFINLGQKFLIVFSELVVLACESLFELLDLIAGVGVYFGDQPLFGLVELIRKGSLHAQSNLLTHIRLQINDRIT